MASEYSGVRAGSTPEGFRRGYREVSTYQTVSITPHSGSENIVAWKGMSFSAARVCLPDGHIYKILSDVPTTNAPSFQDNGYVDPGLYVPAIDPNS